MTHDLTLFSPETHRRFSESKRDTSAERIRQHKAERLQEGDFLVACAPSMWKMKPAYFAITSIILACAPPLAPQQGPDRDFHPAVENPVYAIGQGPVVCLDEGHANFHTLEGRFRAFGELIRRDGYVVRAIRTKFDRQSLAECGILVISNALPNGNPWETYPYPTPSAFAREEIAATHDWVRAGGNLLLIADHMPCAGAAASLAAAFDVTFSDSFAVEGFGADSERDAAFAKPTIFRTADQTLRLHAIVNGRNAKEAVTSIRSFTGQAFRASAMAEPLMVLPSTFIALMPKKAWQFGRDTPRIPAGGWYQGAVMTVDSGRAAFFGEAAMFSAQVAGRSRSPIGMNAPEAEQNSQFVLNLMHWLSRVL